MNLIKINQTLVTSSYIPNEDVCKVLLKTKECETSNTIIIETRVLNNRNITFSKYQRLDGEHMARMFCCLLMCFLIIVVEVFFALLSCLILARGRFLENNNRTRLG